MTNYKDYDLHVSSTHIHVKEGKETVEKAAYNITVLLPDKHTEIYCQKDHTVADKDYKYKFEFIKKTGWEEIKGVESKFDKNSILKDKKIVHFTIPNKNDKDLKDNADLHIVSIAIPLEKEKIKEEEIFKHNGTIHFP